MAHFAINCITRPSYMPENTGCPCLLVLTYASCIKRLRRLRLLALECIRSLQHGRLAIKLLAIVTEDISTLSKFAN